MDSMMVMMMPEEVGPQLSAEGSEGRWPARSAEGEHHHNLGVATEKALSHAPISPACAGKRTKRRISSDDLKHREGT